MRAHSKPPSVKLFGWEVRQPLVRCLLEEAPHTGGVGPGEPLVRGRLRGRFRGFGGRSKCRGPPWGQRRAAAGENALKTAGWLSKRHPSRSKGLTSLAKGLSAWAVGCVGRPGRWLGLCALRLCGSAPNGRSSMWCIHRGSRFSRCVWIPFPGWNLWP